MRSFYKEVIKNFRHVGGLAPSSPYLAKAIASFVPRPLQGMLLELGPGTGSLTKGLLNRGIKQEQIIAIEYSADFTQMMQKKFPNITTLHGKAENLIELLKPLNKPIQVVVSGLPLRIFSPDTVKKIIAAIDEILPPNGYYIQFTYSKKDSPIMALNHFQLIHSKRVLLNMPPARVDAFLKHEK